LTRCRLATHAIQSYTGCALVRFNSLIIFLVRSPIDQLNPPAAAPKTYRNIRVASILCIRATVSLHRPVGRSAGLEQDGRCTLYGISPVCPWRQAGASVIRRNDIRRYARREQRLAVVYTGRRKVAPIVGRWCNGDGRLRPRATRRSPVAGGWSTPPHRLARLRSSKMGVRM
jgi:hypothetical protein